MSAESRKPSYDELLELVNRLQKRIEALEEENRKLRELLEEVRRGGKRQAAPFSKGPPKPDPQKCGRKPGENYGTKAHRQPLSRVDEIYQASLPHSCPDCGGKIELDEVQPQFQVEIPRKPIRRRFDIEIGHCLGCQRRVQGRHALQTSDALGAAASQIGPEAKALAVHLNKDLGLSHGKVSRFFMTAFGLELSRGGSAQIMLRAAERCGDIYRSILVMVRKSAVVYPDETGWKVGGLLQWLWTFVSPEATAYVIQPSRGFEVAEDVLGAEYAGAIIHDGWSPYDHFFKAAHQQCLAHLLRRCADLLESAVRGAVLFPRQVKTLLQEALDLRDRRDEGKVSEHGVAVAVGRLESRLDRILLWIRRNPANERFAKHLNGHRDQLFTFLKMPGVEATSWPADLAIRLAVVNRKVWGGSRTEAGSRAQAILMSVLRTCAQRGRDGIEFLSQVIRAAAPRNHPRLFSRMAPG